MPVEWRRKGGEACVRCGFSSSPLPGAWPLLPWPWPLPVRSLGKAGLGLSRLPPAHAGGAIMLL